jgi:hypothetical protein
VDIEAADELLGVGPLNTSTGRKTLVGADGGCVEVPPAGSALEPTVAYIVGEGQRRLEGWILTWV